MRPLAAVLTGDIVQSTRLSARDQESLQTSLLQLFGRHPHQFYRGDSFQLFLAPAAEALRMALLCRCAAIRLNKDQERGADIRISIGIGNFQGKPEPLGTARGEAFLLSGRAFDAMLTENARLAIAATAPLAHAGLQIAARYADSLLRDRTGRQAEVLFALLQGNTQQQAAKKLQRSNSTIHQHASAARWPEMEKLLTDFQYLINHMP